MTYGSHAPAKPSATRITFACSAEARAELARRSEQLEQHFRTADPVELAELLVDTRPLHRQLFSDLVPALPGAVGTYRGTPGSVVAFARREVRVRDATAEMRAVDPCLAPGDVGPAMAELSERVSAFAAVGAAPGLEEIANVIARFVIIHPYLDGNGHICRLMFIGLARLSGFRVSARWSVHERPHDHRFSRAVQVHEENPDAMTAELGRYLS